jgi:class 3 adenylate cyclase
VAQLPSGTVTFLFTDIEGSTLLVRTLRDGYTAVLAEHERLLCDAFHEHSGQVIDTQGDAFFVAFPRAMQAVEAAVAAQRALAAHKWPEGGEVRVRMGLHTGEPVVGTAATQGSASIARRGSARPGTAGRFCSPARRGSSSRTSSRTEPSCMTLACNS